MARSAKDPDIRRNEILQASAKLFEARGYAETTVDDIVNYMGVAKGTFYYYFASKDDILKALIEAFFDEMEITLTQIANDATLSAMEKLEKISIINGSQHVKRKNMLTYFHKEHSNILRARQEMISKRKLESPVAMIIRQGVDEGVFTTEYPIESGMAVFYIMSNFIGDMLSLPPEEMPGRVKAIQDIVERILGAKPGTLSKIAFIIEGCE